MAHPTKARRFLLICSCFDIIYSSGLIIAVGLLVATCQVEDETVINHNTTLEEIEYFYNALKACGYKEETDIPSSEFICSSLENRVMPFAGLSLALNFILGVYAQIMIHDTHFFLDKEYHKYSRPVSLISIPIGTLISMSLASIALAEYTSPKMCWFSYSVRYQKRSDHYLVAIILIPILVAVYKPLELGIFYIYACSLFSDEAEEHPHSSSKMNPVAQTKGNGESNETPKAQTDTSKNEFQSEKALHSVDESITDWSK